MARQNGHQDGLLYSLYSQLVIIGFTSPPADTHTKSGRYASITTGCHFALRRDSQPTRLEAVRLIHASARAGPLFCTACAPIPTFSDIASPHAVHLIGTIRVFLVVSQSGVKLTGRTWLSWCGQLGTVLFSIRVDGLPIQSHHP